MVPYLAQLSVLLPLPVPMSVVLAYFAPLATGLRCPILIRAITLLISVLEALSTLRSALSSGIAF